MATETPTNRLNLSLDLRAVVLLLLAIIAGMLLLWQPWAAATDQVIEVTGEAKIKATPDEFVFYPSYSFQGEDKPAMLAAITKKSDELVAKLKELGVPENKIKVDSSGYDTLSRGAPEKDSTTYSLSLIVTVTDKALAQKVQDYLVTTAPTGSITPQSSFSEAKRRELEDQARGEATKDAKRKADQIADDLGFRVVRVKSVALLPDQRVFPLQVAEDTAAVAPTKSLGILPGENELTYTVTVTYFIR